VSDTFRRYLGVARVLFNCRKRVMTQRIPLTPDLEQGQ
jgi:hypothetical protein